MQLAADRDRVAHQYASGYEDIFAVGLSRLRDALARGWNEEWGAVACYLRFLATIADSHVVRKFGKATAAALQQRALRVETRFKACDNPESAVPMLLNVDEELKREGINPGTSADLTVATLAASRLETLLTSG
jgi:triphosphoribosyl-dephospho-CoA synthase